MTNVEQIFQAIQRLPVPERLRLIERVVQELAGSSASENVPREAEAASSMIGLFADDPEAVDAMMEVVRENRRTSRLRDVQEEDEKSSS
ncbi:hypothetical protein SOCE26_062220 [Sorangium cellulosum]|uniref:Uncharacterized protein n=1 Tax=Sorangium cellulosum TaxID=56 RepID=A0A2L0EZL9_SORCE|nr:hypothetical protein [Sorangium cellulosum]AUX44754.1 hypothetical protein SOCE26_062220 [Sorangium cellulosum]